VAPPLATGIRPEIHKLQELVDFRPAVEHAGLRAMVAETGRDDTVEVEDRRQQGMDDRKLVVRLASVL
jgi:hypothetical protein